MLQIGDGVQIARRLFAAETAIQIRADPGMARVAGELGDVIADFAPMHLFFEPMDREAHKKGVIGPTSEFVPLAERVRKHYPQMGVCWDSSHIALNGEDLCDSLEASWHTVTQIHFANPVLDLQSPVYGDTHQPFGPPGIIGPQKIADVIMKAEAIGMFVTSLRCYLVCLTKGWISLENFRAA